MSSFSKLTSFVPTLNNSINGAAGDIMIAVTVTCPLSTGSTVYFNIPAEITISNYTSCLKNSGTSVSSVSCDPTTNAVTATLVLSSTLAAGTVFSFNVTNITNPSTNCTTSAFTGMSIFDSDGNQINAYTGTNPTVQTTTPSAGTATLSQVSLTTSISTNYTI
jgi:hypothetical protein